MPNHTASSEAQEHLSYISLATDGHRHAFKSSLLWWENANAFSRRGWSLHSLSQEGEVSPTKEDALWFLIFCLLDRYLRQAVEVVTQRSASSGDPKPLLCWGRGAQETAGQLPCALCPSVPSPCSPAVADPCVTGVVWASPPPQASAHCNQELVGISPGCPKRGYCLHEVFLKWASCLQAITDVGYHPDQNYSLHFPPPELKGSIYTRKLGLGGGEKYV